MGAFVIGEGGSSWRFGPVESHLGNAYRLIEAVKACDADAFKAQWTSDPALMAERRHGKVEEFSILAWPADWIPLLKAKCDEVGIEFMCTVFLAKDIATIEPFVKRFKVASAESSDEGFIDAHLPFCEGPTYSGYRRDIIVSYGFGSTSTYRHDCGPFRRLHCVVAYPTPIEQFNMGRVSNNDCDELRPFDGISDHTTSVLTGALAVAALYSRQGDPCIIEKHVKLDMSRDEDGTPHDNPDYGHSLDASCFTCDLQGQWGCEGNDKCFRQYVRLIREAELAMGTGENVAQECEKVNEGRRVKA